MTELRVGMDLAVLRGLLKAGLVGLPELRAWADAEVAASANPADVYTSIAMCHSVDDARLILGDDSAAPATVVVRSVVRGIMERLESGQIDITQAILKLRWFSQDLQHSHEAVWVEGIIWSDHLEAARGGIFGDMKSLEVDFLTALRGVME
jgi:hypothetical protein